MLSYDEALERVLESVSACATCEVPLLDARGLVLAEDVVSPIQLPPFANSAMDGYAVRAVDVAQAPVALRVVEEMATGRPATRRVDAGEAIKINTGSLLPEGADAIVAVEDTRSGEKEGYVQILLAVSAGSDVRAAGEDVAAGESVLEEGDLIGSRQIALAAAVGRAHLRAVGRPRVAVIGTGSELVEPGSGDLAPGQIYDSNSYALAAQVEEAGGVVAARLRAADSAESLRCALAEAAAAGADVVVTSGGVSVGGYDLVKEIVAERGSVDFWRVAIRPGKPFAFGRWENGLFFGLPGNPASSMVTFELFVRPALRKMRGREDLLRVGAEARLSEDVRHGPGRRSFVRAVTVFEDGGYVTRPAGGQASHLLGPLSRANSLLILPEDISEAPAGSFVTALLLMED